MAIYQIPQTRIDYCAHIILMRRMNETYTLNSSLTRLLLSCFPFVTRSNTRKRTEKGLYYSQSIPNNKYKI